MSKQDGTMDATIRRIAREHLDVETLDTRCSNSLDFHEVAVWQLLQAHQAAYAAGRADGKASRRG